jgi:hypothetical protein
VIALPQGQAPAVMARYPHMLREDAETWTRFLDMKAHGFTRVWYDLHVGDAVQPQAGSPSFLAAVADGVTRKRIDAVALQRDRLWVIEVKPYASMTALGQAITYLDLFRRSYPVSLPCRAAVVCDQIDPDVEYTAERLGVTLLPTGYQPLT